MISTDHNNFTIFKSRNVMFILVIMLFSCSENEVTKKQITNQFMTIAYLDEISYDIRLIKYDFQNDIVKIDTTTMYNYRPNDQGYYYTTYNGMFPERLFNQEGSITLPYTYDGKNVTINKKSYTYTETMFGEMFTSQNPSIDDLNKNTPTYFMIDCKSNEIANIAKYLKGKTRSFVRCDKAKNQFIALQILTIPPATGIMVDKYGNITYPETTQVGVIMNVYDNTTGNQISSSSSGNTDFKVKCFNRSMFTTVDNVSYYNPDDLLLFPKVNTCN